MSIRQKLFGTDGIRGASNQFPIQADIILKVGQALGYLLRKKRGLQSVGRRGAMVLIGKDTRLSGYMLEQALASGLNSMGVWVQLTGPLPTPGIGFLARNMRALAGIVISASHNLYKDNGIKIFDEWGFKISQKMEEEIERLVFCEDLNRLIVSSDQIGRSRRVDDSAGRYIVHVKNTFPLNQNLEGLKIVLDCANGACYKVAPKIFEELGASLVILGNQPNGYNINEKSGTMAIQRMQQEVVKQGADCGISLDGDGDRVMMADELGQLVDGDHILGICAFNLHKAGRLSGNRVVTTHLSNRGLENMLLERGIQLLRTEVGDRNVVEYMKTHGVSLGGEPSGHIIFLNQSTSGDGCVAALNVLAVLHSEKKKLSQLRSTFVSVPQIQRSVIFDRGRKSVYQRDLSQIPGYVDLVDRVLSRLKSRDKEARVYVRFSGTEPAVRVLVEGKDREVIQDGADQITRFLCDKLDGHV